MPFIFLSIAILGTAICSYFLAKIEKQINDICATLLENGYTIEQKNKSKKEIIAKINNEVTVIKVIIGGKNKGIVITNKDTYFMRLYKNATSSHIDSWRLDKVKTFVNKYSNEKRIIIVLNGYARITKYINENELEAVTINNDAFGTKVLSLEDFKKYIKGE